MLWYNLVFKKFNNLPYFLAKILSIIPYSLRPIIGSHYKESSNRILYFKALSSKSQKDLLFNKMRSITQHAYSNTVFYYDHYQKHRFNPLQDLNKFEDLERIPLVYKKDFQGYPLELRSFTAITPKILSNTGGTTGTPLNFYTPAKKVGIEWAHIHHIWYEQIGFSYKDIKLLLVGRSKVNNFVEFDYKRNSLRVDIYAPFEKVFERLVSSFKRIKIRYIHGYPSAIYELAIFCNENKWAKSIITKHLKGVFLTSEFSPIKQRNFIEQVFEAPSFSFYGHSEGCVLAYETQPYNYTPIHSYGFTESVKMQNGHTLVGTNYYNYISPLIRYNTEDIISDICLCDGLLESFKLDQGRQADFILDINNRKILLTALIFGRHHKLFDFCSHIQVKQVKKGHAQILFVPHSPLDLSPEQLFDSSNVEIKFSFKAVSKPIRTPNGKLKLLV